MLSNGNIISGVRNLCHVLLVEPTDSVLSYLPMAHLFQRAGNVMLTTNGGAVGHFGGDIKNIMGDLQLLKPTLWPAVPRILNRIYDKVMGGVKNSGLIKRQLFQKALATKVHYLRINGAFTHKLYDRLVFNKIRNLLGGNVRYIAVGSAPIS